MAEATTVPTRKELPVEDTWRLEDIFPDEAAWQKERQAVLERAKAFARHRGHLGDSADGLLQALVDEDDLWLSLERVYAWAFFTRDQDTTDPKGVSLVQQASAVQAEVATATAFVQPELVGLPAGRIETFLGEREDLATYRYALLEVERRRAHVLDSAVEGALAAFSPVLGAPGDIMGQLSDADLDFGEVQDGEGRLHPLTHSRYMTYIMSGDRELRKNAYLATHRAYDAHRHTFAATLAASVRAEVTSAALRNYPSSLAMQLDSWALPVEIYDRLVDAVRGALPALHRYISWRRGYLGLDTFHFYDIYPPLAAEKDEEITWDEATSTVREALAPLGKAYATRLEQLLTSRYIDWRENTGKAAGAYSAGIYGVHPYILMSFTGRRQGVMTLAHEAGHSLHSMLSSERQTYRNSHYRTFLAEIASTTNEHLLLHHLLARTDDPTQRLVLVDSSIQRFIGAVFRQTYFAEFERDAHRTLAKEGALTAEGLAGSYASLLQAYYGEDLVLDDVSAYEWARIPHFYRPFYVFQYATGLIAAAAIAQSVLDDGAQAAERYIEFLSAGGSDDPLPILAKVGVDLLHGDALRLGLELFSGLVDDVTRLG